MTRIIAQCREIAVQVIREELNLLELKSKAAEPEALTIEQLEQETGFKGYRRLGQEFLAGEESLEYLKNRIERIEKTLKYDANTAALRGLGYAFGISLEGKSSEELLSEIKEFIKDKTEDVCNEVREEYRTADKAYREVSSEYYELQAEKNKLREEWLDLIEAIRVMEHQKHHHLAGLSMLKTELHTKYFEVRLKSFLLYIKKIRACKDYDRKSAAYSEALKQRQELFSLNDDGNLTATYKGYQRVLEQDKAIIEQCQTPEEIRVKLLTVDKGSMGSMVGIAHAFGMTAPIRNYQELNKNELAEICAQKIFEARTISEAI